jgi:hypothetical protein
MWPESFHISCKSLCFHNNVLGRYHRLDAQQDEPVYQHQDANIDGALWHIPSLGWLIGFKRDIGRDRCLMYAQVQTSTIKIEHLLQVKQWLQIHLETQRFMPVDIEISEVMNPPLTLPASESHHHDSIRPNKVRIQW